MFKVIFQDTQDNEIFTKYGKKAVREDYYVVDKNCFCVADGVTRDLKDGTATPYPKTEEEVLKVVEKYPNPSGAYEAAKIVCEEFVREISVQKQNRTEEKMKKIVEKINDAVGKINQGRTIDYLAQDYYCCVAVGGIIVKEKLICFSIGDCNITALDKNKNVVFETINNHAWFEDFVREEYSKKPGYDWNKNEFRKEIRKIYRNHPNLKKEGKDITFGVLSGEKEAMYYVDTYTVDLSEVQYICAYSDGCEPNFENQEEIEKTLQDPQKTVEQGKEKTLVIYEKVR